MRGRPRGACAGAAAHTSGSTAGWGGGQGGREGVETAAARKRSGGCLGGRRRRTPRKPFVRLHREGRLRCQTSGIPHRGCIASGGLLPVVDEGALASRANSEWRCSKRSLAKAGSPIMCATGSLLGWPSGDQRAAHVAQDLKPTVPLKGAKHKTCQNELILFEHT